MKNKLRLLCSLLFVVGCAPVYEEEVQLGEGDVIEEGETAVIPNYSTDEDDYQVLLPYQISKSRGVTTNQLSSRLDISALENDLRRHSLSVFSPDTHVFQEGQYLEQSTLYDWLERFSTDAPLGLNKEVTYSADSPVDEKVAEERNNPKYLSHLLEQNFLVKKDDQTIELAGMSIGISMKQAYRFQTEIGGDYYYETITDEEIDREANRIAGEVVKRLRETEGLESIPIMVAVYKEAKQGSLVSGNMIKKTTVNAGETTLANWEAIDEQYVLFPSSLANTLDPELYSAVERFQEDLREFFPSYVGLIGEGFYQGDQLRRLKLEIPITFKGQAEVNGFTQYTYGLVMERFETHYDLEVIIKSENRQESLIQRKREKEANVYIYD